MKYCPRCQGVYDGRMTKCPMCETSLENADEKMMEKLEKQINKGISGEGVHRDKTDIVLCVLLVAVTAFEIVSFSMGYSSIKTAVIMTAVNVFLVLSLVFKKFFFSHFTFQGLSARKKGLEPDEITPLSFYTTMQKVGYLLWAVVCVYLSSKGFRS